MSAPEFIDERSDLPLQLHHELDDRGLTVWAFRVYAHFVRRAGRNGRIFPTYKSIAETCFRPTFLTAKPETLKRRAMEAVKELELQGLVRVVREKTPDGDNRPNQYFLTARRDWNPLPKEGGGSAVHPPGAVHPPSAMHPEGNQVQANQEEEKKKEGAEKNRARPAPVFSEDSEGQEQPPEPVQNPEQPGQQASQISEAKVLEKVPGGGGRAGAAAAVVIPAPLLAVTGFESEWGEWVAFRRAKGLSCLPVTLGRQLKNLAAHHDPMVVLKYSLDGGYHGLFPERFPIGGPARQGKPRTREEANEKARNTASAVYAALQEKNDVPF